MRNSVRKATSSRRPSARVELRLSGMKAAASRPITSTTSVGLASRWASGRRVYQLTWASAEPTTMAATR
jgi:hypothetical protein